MTIRGVSRRSFLRRTATAGTLLGLGDLAFLSDLPAVSAEEAKPRPGIVQFRPEIEPLVRLLEDTARDRLLEEVARRIKHGLNYQQVVTALQLAGVRNVQPRPSVGFKFHAVLVVNSAHIASLASPDSDRWLPIFWALDYFKSSQARDVREGNWTMSPVSASSVPAASAARQAFVAAMEAWDEDAVDPAIAGLARTAGTNEVFELFYRFGCRDFRSIGHKAIFVAQARRTLECMGWQHAEPVLRSLAYALLNHQGEPNPSTNDLSADRPWRQNQKRVAEIRDNWLDGAADDGATRELLETLRTADPDEACDLIVEQLNRGVATQSIWDAIFDGAAELLVRQPGIVALHALTSSNALYYAFQASGDASTRQMLLLQNAAFLPMFREAMRGRGKVGSQRLDQIEAIPTPSTDDAIEEIFAEVSRNRMMAARRTLGYLEQGDAASLINAARRLVFLKGDDSHDYKFSSAVLEDYYHVSPKWRNHFLAAAVFRLNGSGQGDNPLVKRTREALQS
jgi:hypothetical protein